MFALIFTRMQGRPARIQVVFKILAKFVDDGRFPDLSCLPQYQWLSEWVFFPLPQLLQKYNYSTNKSRDFCQKNDYVILVEAYYSSVIASIL